MSTTRRRSLTPLLGVALLLGTGLLAGCGVSTDDDQPSSGSTVSATPEATPTTSVTPVPSPLPSPSLSATPSSPAASASPSLTIEGALLTADQVPSLADAVRWKQGSTGPVSSDSFGLCAKFDVLSIGAEQAVERRFSAGSQGTANGASAAQQIAAFPDAATTARATKVLQAWHTTCAARVPGTQVKVGPLVAVPVAQGTAWWYLVTYVRNGVGHVHTFGVDVVGNRVSLLSMDHTGQDHDYPPGQDPMELAVKAAAGKLG